MKISTKLFICALLISGFTFSQEHKEIRSVQKGQPQTKTSSTGGTYVSGGIKKEPKPEVKLENLTLEEINQHLKSYKEKYDYVKSNAAEDQYAKESGWYAKMERRIARLELRREEILKASSK